MTLVPTFRCRDFFLPVPAGRFQQNRARLVIFGVWYSGGQKRRKPETSTMIISQDDRKTQHNSRDETVGGSL